MPFLLAERAIKTCSLDARSEGQPRPLLFEDVWSRNRDGRASLEGPFQAVRKDSRYLFFLTRYTSQRSE